MYKIYKVENLITGEIYIGQTKKLLCERKRDHVYEAFKRNRKDKFHSALREFGLRQFSWEIIAKLSSSYKELAKKENELIHQYQSIKYGYNSQIRHDGTSDKRINKHNYRNGFKSPRDTGK